MKLSGGWCSRRIDTALPRLPPGYPAWRPPCICRLLGWPSGSVERLLAELSVSRDLSAQRGQYGFPIRLAPVCSVLDNQRSRMGRIAEPLTSPVHWRGGVRLARGSYPYPIERRSRQLCNSRPGATQVTVPQIVPNLCLFSLVGLCMAWYGALHLTSSVGAK
jgi:hypothetical protein